MTQHAGSGWTNDEIDKLVELYFRVPRPSPTEMALALGRSRQAVFGEIGRLELTQAGPRSRMRTCSCGSRFFSSDFGHRVCFRCKQTEIWRYA